MATSAVLVQLAEVGQLTSSIGRRLEFLARSGLVMEQSFLSDDEECFAEHEKFGGVLQGELGVVPPFPWRGVEGQAVDGGWRHGLAA